MECISIAPVVFVCLFLFVFVFYPLWGAFDGFLPDRKIAKEVRLKFSSGIDFMHKEIATKSAKSLFVIVVYPLALPCMASAAYPKAAFTLITLVLISANLVSGYSCS